MKEEGGYYVSGLPGQNLTGAVAKRENAPAFIFKLSTAIHKQSTLVLNYRPSFVL